MPQFRIVQTADVSPTCCVMCGEHTGPFLDTEQEIPGYGHVYLCAANEPHRAGCLVQGAREVGMWGISQVMAAEGRERDYFARITHLEDELARRDDPVVVGRNELERLRAS